MIQVVAVITTKPGKREDVLEAFRANMPAVHAEDGCIEYAPVVDADGFGSFQTPIGPDTFMVIEKWASADALKAHGAKGVFAYCTHPVLSGKAIKNVENSTMDELVVTDTIPLSAEAAACTRIRQVSVAGLLAETIRRIHSEESVSSLYMD